MSMTQHGINFTRGLSLLPTERQAKLTRPKAAKPLPASKPKPSKQRKPYFFNPADRD